MKINKPMDWEDFSKKGGETTKARYGLEHYRAIGRKSAELRKGKYSKEHYQEMQRRSVEARK